jgi:hypothetical protein
LIREGCVWRRVGASKRQTSGGPLQLRWAPDRGNLPDDRRIAPIGANSDDDMSSRDRLLALLTVLLVIGSFKVAQQVYRYVAFAEERSAIASLQVEVEEAGLGVIDTQLLADSLRRKIARLDDGLRDGRRELERLERQLLVGLVNRSNEVTYRQRLEEYNLAVAERNELFRKWRVAVDDNHAFVDRYNLLVDSIRTVATRMGEPYYPIPTPAELVVRREAAPGDP